MWSSAFLRVLKALIARFFPNGVQSRAERNDLFIVGARCRADNYYSSVLNVEHGLSRQKRVVGSVFPFRLAPTEKLVAVTVGRGGFDGLDF